MNPLEEQLIEMEKGFLRAYKAKDVEAFRKNFAPDYIGLANDGVQTVETEVAKMGRFDIDELHMEDEKVTFPVERVALMTYKMVSTGRFDGKQISGVIHTSTVYVERDGRWQATLHTESIEQ